MTINIFEIHTEKYIGDFTFWIDILSIEYGHNHRHLFHFGNIHHRIYLEILFFNII